MPTSFPVITERLRSTVLAAPETLMPAPLPTALKLSIETVTGADRLGPLIKTPLAPLAVVASAAVGHGEDRCATRCEKRIDNNRGAKITRNCNMIDDYVRARRTTCRKISDAKEAIV